MTWYWHDHRTLLCCGVFTSSVWIKIRPETLVFDVQKVQELRVCILCNTNKIECEIPFAMNCQYYHYTPR